MSKAGEISSTSSPASTSACIAAYSVSDEPTPTATSALGAKGGAEAGITGALASVVNAINDALAPLGAQVLELPVTPERVLRAIGAIHDPAA